MIQTLVAQRIQLCHTRSAAHVAVMNYKCCSCRAATGQVRLQKRVRERDPGGKLRNATQSKDLSRSPPHRASECMCVRESSRGTPTDCFTICHNKRSPTARQDKQCARVSRSRASHVSRAPAAAAAATKMLISVNGPADALATTKFSQSERIGLAQSAVVLCAREAAISCADEYNDNLSQAVDEDAREETGRRMSASYPRTFDRRTLVFAAQTCAVRARLAGAKSFDRSQRADELSAANKLPF